MTSPTAGSPTVRITRASPWALRGVQAEAAVPA